jgi:hypothetical protein
MVYVRTLNTWHCVQTRILFFVNEIKLDLIKPLLLLRGGNYSHMYKAPILCFWHRLIGLRA